MTTKYINANALKSYIRKEYGAQFSEYVLRAILSAIDKQAEVKKTDENTHAMYQRHILRCLLNYHERMMMGHRNCPGGPCETTDKYEAFEGNCPNAVFIDGYADALREAIRCIEIVHEDELLGS